MRQRVARFGVLLTLTLAISLSPSRALAGDPFEIQVYDGTASPPGVPGIELHLNNWSTRAISTPPEAPLTGQFHATLEPSLGITPFWELGAYLQTAVRTDVAVVDWAGAKLRSKFVTPPSWDRHWRLGMNFELSYLPETYDRSRWGGEIRPIVAWQNDGPEFDPALKIARSLGTGAGGGGAVALGIEYYATLGPFSNILPWREQEQQIFQVLDVLSIPRFELNFGVGEGLTAASEGVVVKAIVGYTFETAATRPSLDASNRKLWRGRP
jgi:hypothetical protein